MLGRRGGGARRPRRAQPVARRLRAQCDEEAEEPARALARRLRHRDGRRAQPQRRVAARPRRRRVHLLPVLAAAAGRAEVRPGAHREAVRLTFVSIRTRPTGTLTGFVIYT